MTTHGPRRYRLGATVAALSAAGILLAGCASEDGTATGERSSTTSESIPRAQQWSPTDTGTTSTTPPPLDRDLPPEAAGVDRSSPDATARAALTVWFGWNTNTDEGPNAAAARAMALLTDELANSVTGTSSVTGPNTQWRSWAERRATAAVDVAASTVSVPPESSTEAYRVFDVTQTFRTPQGEVIDTEETSVNVVLTNTGGQWEVCQISQR